MGEIDPVLLDVHLVGIELVEDDAALLVFVEKVPKELACLGAEIIHFRSLIFNNNQHPVEPFQFLLGLVAMNAQPFDREYHVLGGILDSVTAAGRTAFDDVSLVTLNILYLNYFLRIDRNKMRSAEGLLLESVSLYTLPLEMDLAFVVRPGHLLPDVKAEAS